MNTLKNIGLVALSLLVLILLLEFLIFKFIFLPAEIPRLSQTSLGQTLTYAPNQKGVWRIENQVEAIYRINNDGWNSFHSYYQKERTPNLQRIAIIGDSYIEALQVDYDASVAEKLEQLGRNREVNRFGISGAPLSQYIHIYEKTVLQYKPDVVIISVVHNDFLESLYGKETSVFSPAFAKWRLLSNGDYEVVPPQGYKRDWKSFIKGRNIYGYFVTRKHVNIGAIKNAVLERMSRRSQRGQKFTSNIAISDLDDPNFKRIIEVFALELNRVTSGEEIHPRLVIIMDGPRGNSSETCAKKKLIPRIAKLHNIMTETMVSSGIEFYDLWELFHYEECVNGLKLKIPSDGHWSEDAHRVVAKKLDMILESAQ